MDMKILLVGLLLLGSVFAVGYIGMQEQANNKPLVDKPMHKPVHANNALRIAYKKGFRDGLRKARMQCIKSQLSDEQFKQLKEKVMDMRKNGASREEIREFVRGYLEDLGINMP